MKKWILCSYDPFWRKLCLVEHVGYEYLECGLSLSNMEYCKSAIVRLQNTDPWEMFVFHLPYNWHSFADFFSGVIFTNCSKM